MEILSHDWWGGVTGKRPFARATPILAFLSFFYGAGVRLRLWAYRKSLLRKRSLPGFVVSIGNLTVGGTGKTPATCMLAKWASSEGYRVAILSRGYGGGYKAETLEVSNGYDINTGPCEAGDEPYLLALKLPGVPVIISRKRYLAGLKAHTKFGSNFFLLDDGFQHLSLERDVDLVLMDALCPFGNGRLLPRGPLREPLDQLKRADVLIITRVGHQISENDLTDIFEKKFPDKPLFASDHFPEEVVFPGKNEAFAPEFLRGKRIVAFAGIARPDVFRDTIVKLGAEPVFFRAFRDHHTFRPGEIQDLIAKKQRLSADCLLTTEKDWVRLKNQVTGCPDLAYLTIRFSILSGEEVFLRMLKNRLRGVSE
jgi:tetraacyldisaccharide 4'-kinase